MGDLLHAYLTHYKEVKATLPFFEWLNGLGEFGAVVAVRHAFQRGNSAGKDNGANVMPSAVKSMIRGVANLDEQARVRYRVDRHAEILSQAGRPLDTTDMQTGLLGKRMGNICAKPN
ncbi:hypothetical protein [Rubripirellula reticaptiva]|uniref:Uncharacterized protein n=1 Tax=Rubripirellula reticaptiva TaxID=2528013 RepID=A0A5C6F8M5_9BACT|nr:hypothetical protein [Rubripirellula reticaptiva]TWU57655.1 hypothetical protein Poly59_05620 [Rubripirellula reticaptiva]